MTGVDNYIKVWVAPEGASAEERTPTVQDVFPFKSSDAASAALALDRAMLFWRQLPPRLVHLARMTVYRRTSAEVCGALAEIGVPS